MSKITIFLNGKARQVDAGLRVPDLIREHKLPEDLLLVEINGEALHKHRWQETGLAHGDRIELMKMVAGG